MILQIMQMFIPSYGRFQCFKSQHNFHNVRVSGEAASANPEGAKVFKEEMQRIIVDKEYSPEQILNVEEMSLFWKCMPEHTYIHQESKTMPGFKAFEHRVRLLWGRNVAGFEWKFFLIYHSESPRAFKYVSKHSFPVCYHHHKEAWMT